MESIYPFLYIIMGVVVAAIIYRITKEPLGEAVLGIVTLWPLIIMGWIFYWGCYFCVKLTYKAMDILGFPE